MRAIQQHVPGRLQGSPAALAWALVTGEALRAPHIIRNPATAQSKARKRLATLALGNRGEVCSGAVSGLCHCLPRHLLLVTHHAPSWMNHYSDRNAGRQRNPPPCRYPSAQGDGP